MKLQLLILLLFSTPCECVGKLGKSNIVPFIKYSSSSLFEKPSARAGSQSPLCETLIKFNQCVASKFINVIILISSEIKIKYFYFWKIYQY